MTESRVNIFHLFKNHTHIFHSSHKLYFPCSSYWGVWVSAFILYISVIKSRGIPSKRYLSSPMKKFWRLLRPIEKTIFPWRQGIMSGCFIIIFLAWTRMKKLLSKTLPGHCISLIFLPRSNTIT